MDPEYVTGQIKFRSFFGTILSFHLRTVSKILICFSLIKHFRSNLKRYSNIYKYRYCIQSLKNSYLKKFSYYKKRFYLTSIQCLPYMKTTALGLKLVQSFIIFIIPLPKTYVRHSPDVTAKDCQSVCLSKYRELLDYFCKKIAVAMPR